MFLYSFDCRNATFPFHIFLHKIHCFCMCNDFHFGIPWESYVAIKESWREAEEEEKITKTKPKLPWECCLPKYNRPKIDKYCTRFSITLLLSAIRFYWFSFQSQCVLCMFAILYWIRLTGFTKCIDPMEKWNECYGRFWNAKAQTIWWYFLIAY